jgi:hypothetical protein
MMAKRVAGGANIRRGIAAITFTNVLRTTRSTWASNALRGRRGECSTFLRDADAVLVAAAALE